MELNIKFSPEAINVVLSHLDMGSHREVRRVIDDIVTQINAQRAAQADPPADPPSDGQ